LDLVSIGPLQLDRGREPSAPACVRCKFLNRQSAYIAHKVERPGDRGSDNAIWIARNLIVGERRAEFQFPAEPGAAAGLRSGGIGHCPGRTVARPTLVRRRRKRGGEINPGWQSAAEGGRLRAPGEFLRGFDDRSLRPKWRRRERENPEPKQVSVHG